MKKTSRGLADEFLPSVVFSNGPPPSAILEWIRSSLVQATMMALAWTALTVFCACLELYLRFQAGQYMNAVNANAGLEYRTDIHEAADALFGSWPALVHALVAICLINLSIALWRVAATVMEHIKQGRAVAKARKQKIAEQ